MLERLRPVDKRIRVEMARFLATAARLREKERKKVLEASQNKKRHDGKLESDSDDSDSSEDGDDFEEEARPNVRAMFGRNRVADRDMGEDENGEDEEKYRVHKETAAVAMYVRYVYLTHCDVLVYRGQIIIYQTEFLIHSFNIH